MNLLVDIGNSRLKWTLEHDGAINCQEAIDYRRYDVLSQLRRDWSALPAPRKLAIASVAARQLVAGISDLAVSLWPEVELVIPQSTALAYGVRNAYREPDKLGVDRWLAVLAAQHHYTGACCVADCGTAITVDVVDGNGRHLGGVISPGLRMMKKALATDTEALDFNPAEYGTSIACHTGEAIANGTLLAAVGLIDLVLRRQVQPCRLILTGGDADVIAKAIEVPVIVDSNLVFKGLSLFCHTERVA